MTCILRSFIFDFLLATQSAAIAAFEFAGLGDNKSADGAAVDAMRSLINKINAKVRVVIGEGERDNAPMLYIGEELGLGVFELDIAVDPLEGTNLCANFAEGSLSVLGFGQKGALLNAPDVYMEKLFTNYLCNINIENDICENLDIIAKAKGCTVQDLKVTILKRERHQDIIKKIRKSGAKIKLIDDGDIAAILSIIIDGETDLYAGIGGAPEGVLAAIAVKNLGGVMQSRLVFQSEEEKKRAIKIGISNLNKIYTEQDLVTKEAILIATGITSGGLLKGVKQLPSSRLKLQSIVISSCNYFKVTSFADRA